MEREEEQGQPERARLLRRIVLNQEEDRRRIARDLHDHLGQQLSTSIFQLAMLKEKCRREPELFDGLLALEADLKQLDADVDALVHELRPSALDDLGLPAALSKQCQRWAERSGIPVGLHISPVQQERLPNAIETTLYRIAQEALNNVAKHSQATIVDVLLQHRANEVSLIIEDNGIGFEPGTPSGAETGLGLIGMRERAVFVGGKVIIESARGKGAAVFVRIPVRTRSRRARGSE